ncbi:MAG: Gfo/Idh/MocA family oxidoreductase [Candidatus Marinimicrobia bacterium]|nr:Gfo/Idh/MocA family oxidoreductase [Candidatus Neomarinimicrobiota bacterium]MCF7880637.1 Gfo/Idh/MocA family oxidoreductase [Candidatus Neomarinimicrobiota bacterium]
MGNEISRREFIRSLAILATAAPWMATFANYEQVKDNVSSDTVRIGIIGTGSRGTKLLLHLQTIPGVEIVALCDNYLPHLNDGLQLMESSVYSTEAYQELLNRDDIDGVVIATPPHLHPQITIDSLDAGNHVFCEKVMALSPQDCFRMAEKQQETDRILQIGFQRLFDIRYLKAKELITAGEIGPVTAVRANWHRNDNWRRPVRAPKLEVQLNWRLYDEFSGGLMAELGAHQLQIVNWMLDTYPTEVNGTGSINHWDDGRDIYDNIHLIFSYPDGVFLEYSSLLSNSHNGVIEQFLGPKGAIELEAGKYYSETPPKSPGIVQLLEDIEETIFRTVPIGGASWVAGGQDKSDPEYIVPDVSIPSATQLELEAFIQSIRMGEHNQELLNQALSASLTSILANNSIGKRSTHTWTFGDIQ